MPVLHKHSKASRPHRGCLDRRRPFSPSSQQLLISGTRGGQSTCELCLFLLKKRSSTHSGIFSYCLMTHAYPVVTAWHCMLWGFVWRASRSYVVVRHGRTASSKPQRSVELDSGPHYISRSAETTRISM